jgi:type IV pilus biogenesis protein PilP
MRKILFLGLALAGLTATAPALAAPGPQARASQAANPHGQEAGPPALPTMKTLSTLQAQARILAVKVQIAKLEAEIRKANTGPLVSGGHHSGGSISVASIPHGNRRSSAFDGLSVRSIIGYPGRLQAILERPGGGSAHVRPGQSVDGLRIVRITPHNVWTAHDGQSRPLPWRGQRQTAGDIAGGITPDSFPTLGGALPQSGAPMNLGAP